MANLFHSRSGRAMRLVRDNDVAAELMGVNLSRARSSAFMVAAAYAGVGGALYALLQASVTPETFPLTLSITLLTLMGWVASARSVEQSLEGLFTLSARIWWLG